MPDRGQLLRFAAGALLLGVVAFRVDWAQFVRVFGQLQPAWIPAVFLVYTADRLFMAAKWRYLLRAFDLEISFIQAVAHYYMGGMVGLATQWQAGGDIARIVEAGRSTSRYGAVSTSVLLEKIAGLNALTLLAVGSGILLNVHLEFVSHYAAGTIGATGIVVLGVLPFMTIRYLPAERIGDLLRWIPVDQLNRIAEGVAEFDERNQLTRTYPWFFLLTLLEQFMPIMGLALVGWALQIPLSLGEIIAFLPVSMLIARIPISIEAIGVREGLYVFFLTLYGYAAATAFALSLATRVVDITVVGSGAVATNMLWKEKKTDSLRQ